MALVLVMQMNSCVRVAHTDVVSVAHDTMWRTVPRMNIVYAVGID